MPFKHYWFNCILCKGTHVPYFYSRRLSGCQLPHYPFSCAIREYSTCFERQNLYNNNNNNYTIIIISLQQQMPDIHSAHCLKCWLVSSCAWEYVAHTSSLCFFCQPALTSESLNQHRLHVMTAKKICSTVTIVARQPRYLESLICT